jgi:hypothetical protein
VTRAAPARPTAARAPVGAAHACSADLYDATRRPRCNATNRGTKPPVVAARGRDNPLQRKTTCCNARRPVATQRRNRPRRNTASRRPAPTQQATLQRTLRCSDERGRPARPSLAERLLAEIAPRVHLQASPGPGADVGGVSPFSPGADVGGGAHSVPAQMWAGGAQSRRRCGEGGHGKVRGSDEIGYGQSEVWALFRSSGPSRRSDPVRVQ